ncbi:imidazole glycerol phosphate synthase subunit HisH [Celerinatantimonas sp. YJH-8]|uniref:imidazole glycerol phosphate synthase subunit HisH n=1 Tax=Celerinatantimonas sp. YJH-8 TaxID=3228714 RepID=UPI0038C3BC7B
MNIIIDTGCANISSLRFAVERLNYPVQVTADKEAILTAEKVFLPGVGTVKEAMANLRKRDLVAIIRQVEAPLLGICLGMQILGEQSYEGGAYESTTPIECLGLIPGKISKMIAKDVPLPHMGWNQITPSDHPLFQGISANDYFYFVHSYAMPIGDYTLAQCDYGQPFSAAIGQGNFMGVQFHPERSGAAGARLLKNFLEM